MTSMHIAWWLVWVHSKIKEMIYSLVLLLLLPPSIIHNATPPDLIFVKRLTKTKTKTNKKTKSMTKTKIVLLLLLPLYHMGRNLLTVQSLILMSYFWYFWAPFLATYRFAMTKLATFSENIRVPHGLHVSVWTISTFYIALFSEKLCPVAFLTK